MAAIADIPIRVMGSHAGISVGADGPSQMALEDISMIRSLPNSMILSPSDAISMYHCVALMADYSDGISYIRVYEKVYPSSTHPTDRLP